MPLIRPRRAPCGASLLLALVLSLVALACGGEGAGPTTGVGVTTSTPTAAPTESPTVTSTPTAPETATPPVLDVETISDPTLTREDIDCSREFIASGGGEDFPEGFTSARYVVDGVLGAECLEGDLRLDEAWNWLRVVAPASDLEPLILFAGFEAPSTLLAYVEPLYMPDGSTAFQMTVNLGEAEADLIELALTMAHEFTHVFASDDTQLDRTVAPEACPTYHDGEGCFLEGSYLAEWAAEFWGEWLDELVPGVPNEEEVAERCLLDDSFLGSYAATNPEEDFAESFSAYVYDVPVDSPGLEARYEFFDSRPELAAYRARVLAAGYDSLPNQFDGCGF